MESAGLRHLRNEELVQVRPKETDEDKPRKKACLEGKMKKLTPVGPH